MFSEFIEFIEKHSVLILGFGREGKSTYDIIRRHLPKKELGISDRKKIDLKDDYAVIYSGKDYLEAVNDFQVIIKAPGISIKDFSIPKGVIITCQTDLFMNYSECTCIGVTGTKGKTTVATLLHGMLKKGGMKSGLIGSIGVPVLDTLEDGEPEIAIVEMSSSQLEFTTASPEIAVLTNIYPEHIEHHGGFTGYVRSKLNIVRHQTFENFFICNASQSYDGYCDFTTVPATVVKVSSDYSGFEKIAEAACNNPDIIGEHYMKNVFIAASVARRVGISDDDICAAINEFNGIEHRLEFAGEYKEIKFYNDVLATIPKATMCAIEGIGDVDTLIFGGMPVGIDYDEFENYLYNCNVPNLIGLPDTGRQLCTNLVNRGSRKNIILVEDMEEAVKWAFSVTGKGRSCLMSPAASSYNVYKSFEHKGSHFKKLVAKRAD